VHETVFTYFGDADPSARGGIAAIYRDLVADEQRNGPVVADVVVALAGPQLFGADPVDRARRRSCRSTASGRARSSRAQGWYGPAATGWPRSSGSALRTGRCSRWPPGPYVGEGFGCPALDPLLLAAPIVFKGRLVQYVGWILRSAPGKTVAEVHDSPDVKTGVLASSLTKRAAGYISLGFPDPRKLRHLPPRPD
jgi:hypothetical protein